MADATSELDLEIRNFQIEMASDNESDDDLIATVDLIEKLGEGGNIPNLEVIMQEEMQEDSSWSRSRTPADDPVSSIQDNDRFAKCKWLQTRGYRKEFKDETPSDLNSRLRTFYAEVRNAQGEGYTRSTFVGIRASINRHLHSPLYNKTFSLLNDKENYFYFSNQMFVSVLKNIKKDGLDKTEHYQALSDADLLKVRSSRVLSTDQPLPLLRKVWFDLTIGFARRGRET
ncbi:hypothetical protein KUTeg_005460 [Tegillarca granosa]|uniref:Uncharacterized protein n=1 Tax=Tegillarca granosa TaxID=220873 RepID=A0ABQ9FJT5_TEGGR|nr:hypothetical protein KUTeg_005460 [Tegillarca granosa]